MNNNKIFLIDISDAEIAQTLLHYGKMIGVNMVVEVTSERAEGRADFVLRQKIDDCNNLTFYICDANCDANNAELRLFDLPISLGELGQVLLELQHVARAKPLLMLGKSYALDVEKRIILLHNQIMCELTEKESEMLEYIVKSGAIGADKDELLQHVWGYNANAKSRTVEAHLYRLRQKLQEIAKQEMGKQEMGKQDVVDVLIIEVIEGRCYLR